VRANRFCTDLDIKVKAQKLALEAKRRRLEAEEKKAAITFKERKLEAKKRRRE